MAEIEPPPVTKEEMEAYRRGAEQLDWQAKWLTVIRWPVFGILLGAFYLGLFYPDIDNAGGGILIFGAVVVTMAFAMPFLWVTRKQMRTFRIHDKMINRLIWEESRRDNR